MNSTNKKPPAARGIPQPFKPAGFAHEFKPPVAQLKNAVSAQSVKQPVAPPVYRAPAKPVVAQAKMARPSQMKTDPVAPPIYRPQPVPRVLQTKTLREQSADKFRPKPLAPSVYRTQPISRVLQRRVGTLPQPLDEKTGPAPIASSLEPAPLARREVMRGRQLPIASSKTRAVISANSVTLRTVLQLAQDKKFTKKKKTKNKRALEAEKESAKNYTMPEKQKGAKKKDQKEKQQKKFDNVMNKFASNLLNVSESSIYTGGHSKTRHGQGMTREKLVERKIKVATNFSTDKDQAAAVSAILKAKETEIKQWFDSKKEDRLVVSIERPKDINVVGVEKSHGQYSDMEKSDLGYIVAVFQKDAYEKDKNPWGLVTCYPSKNASG